MFLSYSSLVIPLLLSSTVQAIKCAPSPAYPVPELPPSDPALEPIKIALADAIADLLKQDEQSRHDPSIKPILWSNITSFSLEVTTKEGSFWEYHHSAPIQGTAESNEHLHKSTDPTSQDHDISHESKKDELKRSTLESLSQPPSTKPKKVDNQTYYRIASITKSYTVLALLLSNLNLDTPITHYIPELTLPSPGWDWCECGTCMDAALSDFEEQYDFNFDNLANYPNWDTITLRQLATQLSGLARQWGMFDLLDVAPHASQLWELGFPPPDASSPSVPRGRNGYWTEAEMLEGVKWQYPIFAPNHISTYSNTGFILLGIVLARVHSRDRDGGGNVSYAQVVREKVLKPLGLRRTVFETPREEEGVIPWGGSDWNWGAEVNWPTGGLYSCSGDMARYVRGNLNSELLREEQTRGWWLPHSGTQGLGSFYGMPWEMLRTTRVTSDNRTVTIATKGGGLKGYYSNIAMVPEFGVGVVVLVAGQYNALGVLQQTVHDVLLKGVDWAMRERVREKYTGLFVPAKGNLNSSVELGMGQHGGLVVQNWLSNGTEFLGVLIKAFGWPPLDNDETAEGKEARLLPTGLTRSVEKKDGKTEIGEVWRMEFVDLEDEAGQKVWDEACAGDYDEGSFDGRAVNELVFFKDDSGALERVRIEMLKIELVRQTRAKEWMSAARGFAKKWGQMVLGNEM
ncbi:MAG: hypothetical protein M1820_010527 [Bogoriella megaspora]|nr:MAG: hypothetical protein M1820_010527 [Bogoriella megaspora]